MSKWDELKRISELAEINYTGLPGEFTVAKNDFHWAITPEIILELIEDSERYRSLLAGNEAAGYLLVPSEPTELVINVAKSYITATNKGTLFGVKSALVAALRAAAMEGKSNGRP